MYAQVEKSKDNKNRTVANSVSQKKNSVKQALGFVDSRTQKLSIGVSTIQQVTDDGKSGGSLEDGGMHGQRNQLQHGAMQNVPSTLHHVIPRNKLSTLWNRIRELNKFSDTKIQTSFKSVADRAIGATQDPARLWQQDSNGQQMTAAEMRDSVKKANDNSVDALTNAEQDRAGAMERALQWMPGNIHNGPTNRLIPGNDGWDEGKDDGGDEFEKSAKKVMPRKQFTKLEALNNSIDDGKPTGKNISSYIRRMADQIQDISRVNSITAYDATKWEYDELKNKYRLK